MIRFASNGKALLAEKVHYDDLAKHPTVIKHQSLCLKLIHVLDTSTKFLKPS